MVSRKIVSRITVPTNYAIGPNSGKGIMADDPSRYPASPDGSHDFSAAFSGSLVPAVGPDGETKVVQIAYDAGGTSYGQLRNRVAAEQLYVGNGGTPGVLNSFGVWVNNPSGKTLDFTVSFYNTNSVYKGQINMAASAAPGWRFYIATYPGFAGVSWTAADKSSYLRYGVSTLETTWAAGDMLQFGKAYFNPRSRPKFIICTDDSLTSNVINGPNFPTGYPASGGNYLDICNYYGFKANCFTITGLVGSGGGYMTWDQIATLAAAGWDICNHHTLDYVGSGNQGITYLTYDQILADTLAAKAALDAHGYAATSDILAFAQGAWTDAAVSAARAAGMRCLVGISAYTGSMGIPVGRHSNGGTTNGTGLATISNGLLDITSRVQVDGSPTLANIQSYIDAVIRVGGTGGCYTHGIDATTATKFDGMCAYLKTKVQQGAIDVVRISDWLAGTNLL
jgi:hypothetical protein